MDDKFECARRRFGLAECLVFDYFPAPRKSSNLACTLSGHGSWVLSVDFAPDKQHFVSSSSDHTVKVWDFAQRNCIHTFKDHHEQVGSSQ